MNLSAHSFTSIFDEEYDAVVFGLGYTGLAALRILQSANFKILVIDPSGQLLWESTRALENRLDTLSPCPEWCEWTDTISKQGGSSDGFLEIAFAEISVARKLLENRATVHTILYALPVAVRMDSGRITTATLATKAGFKTVRGRLWIDASEKGSLAALCKQDAALPVRIPDTLLHSLTLHSEAWEDYAPLLEAFCADSGTTLTRSSRPTDRRLIWISGNSAWHREVFDLVTQLRSRIPEGHAVAVGLCSSAPFPIYRNPAPKAPTLPENLLPLSPAISTSPMETLADRFALGISKTRRWLNELPDIRTDLSTTRNLETPRPIREWTCDVVVAGTGTSGALAALAAAREGARVIALEFASFPGGVGTGAGISGYFHGIEGGLQVEIDAKTSEMNLLLEGASPSPRHWHHDGKKLALLNLFEKNHVTFFGNALLCGIEKNSGGRLDALLAATEDGLIRIRAASFIDSTGDGDLCALAGNAFQTGRSGDGRTLAYSQPAFALKPPGGRPGVITRNFDAGWTDPTDPEDLTRARLEGVAQYWKSPWQGDRLPLAITALPGIRQSRRILTDYTLTFADLVSHARFADSIGSAGSIADTHSVDFEFEEDEAVFFYWICRLFRYPLETELPYRILLPGSLENVWIACRAAGIDTTASYAVRMQRDMQRLGEVAGTAAAIAASNGGESRHVDFSRLKARLSSNGTHGVDETSPPTSDTNGLQLLSSGKPGIHLWWIFRNPEAHKTQILSLLETGSPATSFYAAAILAMWNDPRAESRLVQSIITKESGPPASPENSGAFGQEIDVPFWLLGIILLRRCGTTDCLEALRTEADNPDAILNIRTAIALTVERLAAASRIPPEAAVEIFERLIRYPLPDPIQLPSRSIWRSLRGEPQMQLRNDSGCHTGQDHSWQLHLIGCRIRTIAHLPNRDLAFPFLSDSRANIRREFELVATP